MPPPEQQPPRLKPKLRKPKPKPKHKTGPEQKPMPAKPRPEQMRDSVPGGGVPFLQQPFACDAYPLCPPPPPSAPPATVHLHSGRLPTPLIALSASLLAVSALLLLALLVYRLVLRRRRRRNAPPQQEAPRHDDDDEESVLGVAAVAWELGEGEEDEVDSGDGGGVHHVWYIQTKGLDERAIAAIAAVVYDGAKMKKRNGGDGDGGCAVCLAEFRDGETLRLLPRCGHAFHRGCIDTWLRAHVNCPLCRAPVQVAASAAGAAKGGGGEAETNLGAVSDIRTEEAEHGGVPDRAVRRAASMVALPRRAWPDVSLRWPAASSSGREEEMTGLGKIRRLLKLSDAPVVAGVGRSVSFGGAGSCQRLPTRSGPSTAADGVTGDEIELSR